MTKICCAHGCKSNSKNSPELKFYNLATARGTLPEWLQAFPFRYSLDIFSEVKRVKESSFNICEVHFSREDHLPEPKPKVIEDRRSSSTQTQSAYLSTKLKISPVEIVEIQPESSAMVSEMNNVMMEPVINSNIPAFFQPCNTDIGAIGEFVANMNAAQQTQFNTVGFVTSLNTDQLRTDNVTNLNSVQIQCTNRAGFVAINAAQSRTDNVINTGFCFDSPGVLPMIQPGFFAINAAQTSTNNIISPGFCMDSPSVLPLIQPGFVATNATQPRTNNLIRVLKDSPGVLPVKRPNSYIRLPNRNFAPIRIRPKPRILRTMQPKTNPALVPEMITNINAVQSDVQPRNIVGVPGSATATKFIQPSPYIHGFVSHTINVQPDVDAMKAENVNNALHINNPVKIANDEPIKIDDGDPTKVEDEDAIKIEHNDGIREPDGNDYVNAELRILDTDQDEIIKIEFPTENNENLVKFEVDESKDDIETYNFLEDNGVKKRNLDSETMCSDFNIDKFSINTDHDYT